MVTVVQSLVGTSAKYAQAQVRSRGDRDLRLQIPTGGGDWVELGFEVPKHVYETVRDLLVEATKPVVKEIPPIKAVIATPPTLEERVANIEGFLSTILITN
jgi:hypothetical protein